jgi:cysteine desulfurase
MSTQARIYLDWNATAPMCDAARLAITRALAEAGNPSSVHAEGRQARDRIERARAEIAGLTGRSREQHVFTSGGTEANWLGVHALARAAEARGLPRVAATTRLEHPSLLGAVDALCERGWSVRHGLDDLRGVGLVATSAVNHELGTVLEHAALGAHGALVHIDAVQAAGKLPLASLSADALALSAHKLGGPQGVGALAIAVDGALPVAFAGHQERGRRPGTENLLGIVGFGAAAAAADAADWPRVTALGEQLERGLLALGGVRIHGADARRVGGTVNAGFAGARGQDVVIALDLAGIAAATGAACTSGSVQPSQVLLALGVSAEQAREAVRFSLGRTTTAAEIGEVLRVLPQILDRARRHR